MYEYVSGDKRYNAQSVPLSQVVVDEKDVGRFLTRTNNFLASCGSAPPRVLRICWAGK